MKNKILLVLSIAMLQAATSSYAGKIESTTVESIQAHSDKMKGNVKGLLLYGFADLPTDSPACATDPEGRMIFPYGDTLDENNFYSSSQYSTADGRGVYTVRREFLTSDIRVIEYLKEAYDNDSLLDVVGTGDCFLGFEVVQYIILKK